MKQTFYSNGKLLITGEYLVLDGAKALALPTQFGQTLDIEPGTGKTIRWKSFDHDGSIWFDADISFSDIENKTKFEDAVKNTLIAILHEAFLLHSEFVEKSDGYTIATKLNFPKVWGLGTSSTLINNIAQWLEIDAYRLLNNSFGGSGYDIACAQHNHPIVYSLLDGKPIVTEIAFHPPFTDQLYFVYLNKKQSSKSAITAYRNREHATKSVISEIDKITNAVINASDLKSFCLAVEQHESILSEILQLPTVKSNLFPDFNGIVKSLGAWGGDFVLVAAEENPTHYFQSKGFSVIIPYSKIILK